MPARVMSLADPAAGQHPAADAVLPPHPPEGDTHAP